MGASWRHRAAALFVVAALSSCASPGIRHWHTVELDEEFSAGASEEVGSFEDYVALEARLFREVSERIFDSGDGQTIAENSRYRVGGPADLRNATPDWNRSLEMAAADPRGGVLLLHGMSDSPYSLHRFATALGDANYHVLALRYPGHGTIPSGLRHIRQRDLTAAVRLAAEHLSTAVGSRPLHIIGYSTGATLAVEYALDAIADDRLTAPSSLVLISPAVRVHAAAGLARVKNGLAILPGADGLGWLDVQPETDPYKYNSFATNAAAVVHELTRSVDRRVRSAPVATRQAMPPVLAIKSTVDATVSTDAVVDNLLEPLDRGDHELLLFDVNHYAKRRGQMNAAPDRFTQRLLNGGARSFALTVVSNDSPDTRAVSARTRPAGSGSFEDAVPLANPWPADTLSLSHIALPFPPDDPIYGNTPPADDSAPWFGNLSLRGERGVSAMPAEFLLRMRYNPFFDYTLERTLDWLETASRKGS